MSRRSNIASIFGSAPAAPMPPAAAATAEVPNATPVAAPPAAVPDAATDEAAPSKLTAVNLSPRRASAGPVRKLGEHIQRLETLERVEAENKALREALASGATVLELDPALVEGSFVRDRFASPAELDVGSLQRSIEERGQEVPILVRPHPQKAGHYQIAYGHRRLKAIRALGRKVRAVVRDMTDLELIVAQGVENSERQDLSFIERAVFAATLEKTGYDRDIIAAALSVDKTELARLLVIARSIPEHLVRAIGPAPKVGRERWMTFSKALENQSVIKSVEKVIQESDFVAADSDTRFLRVLAVASRPAAKTQKPAVRNWKSPSGKVLAKVTRTEKGTTISFDAKTDTGFSEFLERKFDELYAEFAAQSN